MVEAALGCEGEFVEGCGCVGRLVVMGGICVKGVDLDEVKCY